MAPLKLLLTRPYHCFLVARVLHQEWRAIEHIQVVLHLAHNGIRGPKKIIRDRPPPGNIAFFFPAFFSLKTLGAKQLGARSETSRILLLVSRHTDTPFYEFPLALARSPVRINKKL